MTDIFKIFKSFKSLFFIGMLLKLLKQIWPIILIFLFLPEINAELSKYSFWGVFKEATGRLAKIAEPVREIPVMKQLLQGILWIIQILKNRLHILLKN